MIKRIGFILLAICLTVSLMTAEAETNEPAASSRILIAYWTRLGNSEEGFPEVDATTSASVQIKDGEYVGNAELIARWIAEETGGGLYAIHTKKKFPADYNETVDVVEGDHAAGVPYPLAEEVGDLSSYDTVFLCYPIWVYELPVPMYSFLESADLSGKTVYCFTTHKGSGMAGTVRIIQGLEPEATVLEGLPIPGNRAADYEADVKAWLTNHTFTK